MLLDSAGHPVRRAIGFNAAIVRESPPKAHIELASAIGGASVPREPNEPVEQERFK